MQGVFNSKGKTGHNMDPESIKKDLQSLFNRNKNPLLCASGFALQQVMPLEKTEEIKNLRLENLTLVAALTKHIESEQAHFNAMNACSKFEIAT